MSACKNRVMSNLSARYLCLCAFYLCLCVRVKIVGIPDMLPTCATPSNQSLYLSRAGHAMIRSVVAEVSPSEFPLVSVREGSKGAKQTKQKIETE